MFSCLPPPKGALLAHGLTHFPHCVCLWLRIQCHRIYRELFAKLLPDVIVEVGNYAGGSALFFADLFNTIGHGTGRIIAVDIDHSRVHRKAKSHPRITWIEADALVAFEQVRSLISPRPGGRGRVTLLRTHPRDYAALRHTGDQRVLHDHRREPTRLFTWVGLDTLQVPMGTM